MRIHVAAGASALLALCLALAGCSPSTPTVNAGALSPLVGKWTGKSDMKDKGVGSFVNALKGGPLTGPSALTLNADGTGFLKVADQPERPLSWKQEGDKVILQENNTSGSVENPGASSAGAGGKTWVGTLSPDRRTLVVDMDRVKVTLTRQPSGR